MTALDDALQYARLTKLSTDEWLARVRKGQYTPAQLKATPHYKAHAALLEAAKPPAPTPVPPPVPPPAHSVFAGKGLFCTNDASTASGLQSDWVAVQKDPEGDPAPTFNNNPGRMFFWQARATQAVADEGNRKGVPYIGQAENLPELVACLKLDLMVPKALVGNAGAWGPTEHDQKANQARALAQGWDYISEWYMNAHPWEHEPTGHNYPRFVSVCPGIYSEGEPGGQGYVAQIPLDPYLDVWKGSFCPWKAEAMTDADRARYNAA